MIHCHTQVVWLSGHGGRLRFFGLSPEIQQLPPERAGAMQTIIYHVQYIIINT